MFYFNHEHDKQNFMRYYMNNNKKENNNNRKSVNLLRNFYRKRRNFLS